MQDSSPDATSGDQQAHVRVCKWDELQHYKDRDPPWIKLYNRLLDSHRWGRLPDASKGHYTGLLMLASRTGNEIPLDVDWIAGRIAATAPVDLRPLLSAGLIELYHHDSEPISQDASNMQAFARSREERREEGEAETEGSEGSLPTVENTSGPRPDVENSQNGNNWNERLAPLIREVAYNGDGAPPGHSLPRCLSKAKELLSKGYTVEDLEDAIHGLRGMADRKHPQVRDWIAPEDRFTMLAFGRAEERGQKLVQLAAAHHRKHAEPNADLGAMS